MFCQMLFLTGDGDSHAIVNRLSKLSRNSTFTELYISSIKIDDIIIQAVGRTLQYKRFPVGVHIAHCTGMINELVELLLSSSSSSTHGSSGDNHKVQKLTMLGDHEVDFTALGRGLAHKTNNASLKKLAIQAPLSEATARSLGQGIRTCKTLQDLSLSISGITESAATALANGLQKNVSIQTLKLIRSGAKFMQKGDEEQDERNLSAILKALKKQQKYQFRHTVAPPSLRKLVLQNSACRTAGIPALAGILRSRYCRLTQLEVTNYRYRTEVLQDLPILLDALQVNESLRKLSLSGHYLSEQDTSNLACSLSTSELLEELCITNSGINDTSACILAMWLYELSSLKRLLLKDNPFGSVGAREICEAVKLHWELEEVLLPLQHKWQSMIEFHLLLNAGGRRLLRDHDIPASIWPQVFARDMCNWESAPPNNTIRHHSYDNNNNNWQSSTIQKDDEIKSAQSDIIYHLLQGPATLYR